MIICNPLKIIFVKTKKTAGTSFEIALSKFCESNCVITPLTPNDEALRKSLGFRKAQNYKNIYWKEYRLKTDGMFSSHISASILCETIPKEIWNNYKKITIFRNPFETIISKYFWIGGEKTGMHFSNFVKKNKSLLKDNLRIAPLKGKSKLDFYLKYQNIEEDLQSLKLKKLYDVFKNIHAKSNTRPKNISSANLYKANSDIISIIEDECKDEIEYFGYNLPKYN